MLNADGMRDVAALLDVPPAGSAAALPRRAVLRGALGAGYALAALPVVAQTAIRTPADGLTVGEVMVPVGQETIPVYRAAPAGRSGLPVVLVISEIFGVHEYIADTARRFARAGYLALAPDLFVRQGDPQGYGELARLISELVAKVPDAQVMRDLDACVDWAAAHGGDAARVAVTGFCWGGRHTWLYAAHSARVKAAVAWYGRLEGERNPLQPRHPIDVVGELKAPVLGLYGGADTGIPLASVERMKAALAQGSAAARASTFVVYPDAPHAFHADYRPSYRQAAAEDGWQRCRDWLARHGVV
ncbi:Carboxymethylenebutenolidase [Tepidimonas thermarum]|uniref:Carboxymethylenebutenolidase n=1 Tax=Tepidimonas thermarum TaxID=335431 RepID=A0A554WZF1_9BURK|nr:Carboxymethylenebutenolidase [Tepidimonas thermarum]